MRARILLIALISGLLAACGDSAPPPTPPSAVADTAISTPTTSGEADEPTSESAPEDTPEATPEEVPEETPEETPQETPAPPPTIAFPSNPATPVPIPDGPLTIVALGDSLTEGDGDYPGEGGGYPARLQRSINEIRPGSRVINLGKSGWDSQQMLEGQLPTALQSNPDIALVWIGSNNLWYNNGPGEGQAFDLSTYTTHIDETLRALTGAGARVFIALLDDHALRPYTSSPEGAGLSGEGLEHMTRLGNAFNDIIRAKAAEYGATIVDFYNTTIFSDPSTLSEDGIHANPKGHDVVAQMWFDAIRQALQP